MAVYFPYVFRTIPLSYDDSMSYYEQLLAINKVLDSYSEEIAKIETTINGLEDEILKKVNQQLLLFTTEIKEEISDLQKAVEKEISDLESSTNEKITALEDNVEKSLQDFQNVVNTKFEKQNKKIEDFIVSESEKFDNFSEEIDTKFTKLRSEFFDLLESLDKIYAYIDSQNDVYWNKLKDYCDEIYIKRNIYYVKNPVTGKIGEINSVLDLIYQITNHAVTCDEFAYIGITAQEYADLNYTCIEYLKKYKDLYWQKFYTEQTSMQNPYTGKFQNVVEIVKQLVKFHEEVNSLTADEYAALNLTADDYASKNVTSYDYYVKGKQIFA